MVVSIFMDSNNSNINKTPSPIKPAQPNKTPNKNQFMIFNYYKCTADAKILYLYKHIQCVWKKKSPQYFRHNFDKFRQFRNFWHESSSYFSVVENLAQHYNIIMWRWCHI